MKPRICWIAEKLLVLVVLTVFARGQSTERLIITSPQDGAVIPMQNQVLIEGQFEPPVDFIATVVDARVEATRGSEQIVIADGDIRSPVTFDRLSALWDITKAKPGDYVITLTASTGTRTGVGSIHVTLHPIPKPSVRLISVENQGDGALVTFAAEGHSPKGTPIDDFIWTPGDGDAPTRTTTGSYSHLYPARDTTYILWLEVNDVLGGSALIARDLFVGLAPNQGLRKTTDCGCDKMTLMVPKADAAAQSGVYCAPKGKDPSKFPPVCAAVPNPAPADKCADDEVAFNCPLGSLQTARFVGWSFEVVASLSGNTNQPESCTQGQYNRSSLTFNGMNANDPEAQDSPPAGQVTLPGDNGKDFTFKAVAAKDAYPPFAGPDYGADDYTVTRDLKRHQPGVFRWLDWPGLILPANAQSLTDDAEFVTFVRGSLGTCWCDFSIKQSWTKAGGVKGPGLKLIQGHNCSLSNAPQIEQVQLLPHDDHALPVRPEK